METVTIDLGQAYFVSDITSSSFVEQGFIVFFMTLLRGQISTH